MKNTASFIYDISKAKFVNVETDTQKFESTIKRFFKDWEEAIHKKLDNKSKEVKKAFEDLSPDQIEAIVKLQIGTLPMYR